MELGEKIRNKRLELQLSQEYIAEQLGVNEETVSSWESGISELTEQNLSELADIFHITVSELTGEEDSSQYSVKNGFTRVVELIATMTLILIILKALNLIELSWTWVLCPLWVLAFIFLMVIFVIIVARLTEEKRAKKEKKC